MDLRDGIKARRAETPLRLGSREPGPASRTRQRSANFYVDFRAFARHLLCMPSTRPPSLIDLFAGGDKLRDIYELVGLVVTNFGGIEETLRYLDWQLQAYALVAAMPAGIALNDVQISLTTPREDYFAKHMVLSKILRAIDKGLSHASMVAGLGSGAAAVSTEWQGLRATAYSLGNRRNALAHAAIAVSGASVVRSMGLLESATTVNPLDDKQLTADIGNFRLLLGAFINKLTAALPFRDHNIAIFAETVAVIS